MVERSRYYPEMPPALEGETDEQYTDRLTGADRTDRVPYDHVRNRGCSIGYHEDCTDPAGERCKCPCHREEGAAKVFYLVVKLYEDGRITEHEAATLVGLDRLGWRRALAAASTDNALFPASGTHRTMEGK